MNWSHFDSSNLRRRSFCHGVSVSFMRSFEYSVLFLLHGFALSQICHIVVAKLVLWHTKAHTIPLIGVSRWRSTGRDFLHTPCTSFQIAMIILTFVTLRPNLSPENLYGFPFPFGTSNCTNRSRTIAWPWPLKNHLSELDAVNTWGHNPFFHQEHPREWPRRSHLQQDLWSFPEPRFHIQTSPPGF